MPRTLERLPNGLVLWQDDAYFKLGQDSVLLAAFARVRPRDRVLDLGCGTGALSLLVYRPGLQITGLELQEGPLSLFRTSIAENDVPISTLQGDMRNIRQLIPHGSADHVICNPPYGERLLDLRQAEELYRTMGKVFERKPGWSYTVISPDDTFEACFGRKADKRRKLYNGMIKCQLYFYFKA